MAEEKKKGRKRKDNLINIKEIFDENKKSIYD